MLAFVDDQQLPGMPHPWPLRVTRTGDGRAVAVHAGPLLLSAFSAGDLEMRDLVICSLTEGSRFQGRTVAAAFGIQPSQVSRIRSRYRQHGASGLARQMGRPPILSPARLRQARQWAGQGLPPAEIGHRLGVSRSRISELIKQHGTLPAPGPLFEEAEVTEATAAGPAAGDGEDTAPGQRPGTTESTTVGEGEQDTGGSGDGAGTDGQSAGDEPAGAAGDGEGAGGGGGRGGVGGRSGGDGGAGAEGGGEGASWRVATRIESGTVACRYAGAMLVHAFADRIGAGGLLRGGTGGCAGSTR